MYTQDNWIQLGGAGERDSQDVAQTSEDGFKKKWLVLFSTEDRIFYKMYGKDWDSFVEHMEENL